jgi:hypothetical protein
VERESRWRSIRRNASKQSIESVSCNGFAVPLSGHSLAQLLGTPRRELDGHRPIAKAKSVTASYIPQFELESAQLSKIASCLAVEAEVPVGDTCCGTAGDRGLLHPELVVSATTDTKCALGVKRADGLISANRTCEMGLLHATGRPYQSFVFLLEELSRPEQRT